MTYGEQLKDPRWQRKRLEILERDGFSCLSCGDKEKQLHVHHGAYLSKMKVWEYPENMLHTLCCDCHEHVESCIYEMNGSIASMKPSEAMFFLIKNIASVASLLTEYDINIIESVSNNAVERSHLLWQINELNTIE
jgi:hypothetical protein